jgi:hypothetical protein
MVESVTDLYVMLKALLDSYDLRYQQRFDAQQEALVAALNAQKEAVAAALMAADRAVAKAELANDKRFDSVAAELDRVAATTGASSAGVAAVSAFKTNQLAYVAVGVSSLTAVIYYLVTHVH